MPSLIHRMAETENYLQRIPVGEQLSYLEYRVTDEKLRRFREMVEYPESVYLNLAAREYLEVLTRKYGPPRSAVSVAHTDHYLSPPQVGRRVQVTGWVREKQRSRSVELLRVETFAVDEIGGLILRSEHTFQFGAPQRAERQGRNPARLNRGAGGKYLPPVSKRVTEEIIEAFESSARFLRDADEEFTAPSLSNTHSGAELARGMGLAGSVAPGELSVAYLHELLARYFGMDFWQGGRLAVNYLRPVYANDSLTAQGVAAQQESVDGRVNWRTQVWLENQRGERVAAGEAWVTVPSPLT